MKLIKSLLAVSIVTVAGAANAAVYTISGNFDTPLNVGGTPAVMNFNVNSGSYDSDAGTGSWNLTADLTQVLGAGSISFSQSFSLDAVTGTGALGTPTGCVGAPVACNGLGASLVGSINAGGPIVGGVQTWTVPGTAFGDLVFRPTLTADAPAVPVPAAAWLFGSGLLGLAGATRRRNKN